MTTMIMKKILRYNASYSSSRSSSSRFRLSTSSSSSSSSLSSLSTNRKMMGMMMMVRMTCWRRSVSRSSIRSSSSISTASFENNNMEQQQEEESNTTTTTATTTATNMIDKNKNDTTTTTTKLNVNDNTNNDNNDTTTKQQQPIKSLALSVYFKQPELGMNDYEILCRATAYLIGIGMKPSNTTEFGGDGDIDNPYKHLEIAENERKMKTFQQYHKMKPNSTARNRQLIDLGWLEFVPIEVRPKVHIICSSHVVAPYLWRDYYPNDWLQHVQEQHCKYVLEVYEHQQQNNNQQQQQQELQEQTSTSSSSSSIIQPLASYTLTSKPYHHPEGRDIALLHFLDQEDRAIKQLKKIGVDILYLRPNEKLYQKGEDVYFHGYHVKAVAPQEPNTIVGGGGGNPSFNTTQDINSKTDTQQEEEVEEEDGKMNNNNNNTTDDDDDNVDQRIFYPYKEHGQLSYHTKDRFFASTNDIPLPEGLCGGPVLDKDGLLCGTVEGIVPVHFKNKNLAGHAAFFPSYMMKLFIDQYEHGLLKQMIPSQHLYNLIVTAKETNSIGGGFFKKKTNTTTSAADESSTKYTEKITFDDANNEITKQIQSKCTTKEQYDTIMDQIYKERDEIMNLMNDPKNKNAISDVDDAIRLIQQKAYNMREIILNQYRKEQIELNSTTSKQTNKQTKK